ncbi:MAG: hypothetical protein JO354_12140 [Verrucomicrobia bacterium]|nr:hypothetical protein [Verrucomicrobiota bacterium]
MFLFALAIVALPARAERPFDFKRDTFGFANMTVFAYENGVPHLRHDDPAKQERYTRRCFVLSRSAWQFRKFARFAPHAPAIDNAELIRRIRTVTRRAAWKPALPENQRIIFPYADVRALSEKHGRLLQENVGLGWPTYWRPGNWRVFFATGRGYQEQTHAHLNEALARDDMFVGYLTTLPNLSINHAVLFYSRRTDPKNGIDHYLVYDSNHPEAPRHLTWSDRDRSFSYEKDWDFVGGKIRVYQVYGKAFQ